MTKSELNFGDFAFCSKGEVGLILWKHKHLDKKTKKSLTLYRGINLTPGKKWGLKWESKSPQKVTKSKLKKIMDGKIIYYDGA